MLGHGDVAFPPSTDFPIDFHIHFFIISVSSSQAIYISYNRSYRFCISVTSSSIAIFAEGNETQTRWVANAAICHKFMVLTTNNAKGVMPAVNISLLSSFFFGGLFCEGMDAELLFFDPPALSLVVVHCFNAPHTSVHR